MRRAGLALPLLLVLLAFNAPDSITICHRPGPLEDPFGIGSKTITVTQAALQAHLRHGDTVGACGAAPTPRPTPRPTPQPTPRPTPRPQPTPVPTTRPPGQPPATDPLATPAPTTPPTDTV